MTNPDSGTAHNDMATGQAIRAEWEAPKTIEIDLGNAETANTNSNFDGTNYSS